MSWLYKSCLLFLMAMVCCAIVAVLAGKPQTNVETISDPKDWKKLLRTRSNVLALYSNGAVSSDLAGVLAQVSRDLRGTATVVAIDCSGAGKKLCKKNKASPPPSNSPPLLRHYKDGEYYKEYDRRLTAPSMTTFLRDPTGDLPWDEDEHGKDVLHVNDVASLNKLLKAKKSFLMMFYAPWCGFCKRLKPDYSAAASEVKSEGLLLAAMDVNKPENSAARDKYNITGFPTLVFFESGKLKFNYEGENTQTGLVSFIRNPQQSLVQKPVEESWFDTPSHVHHLTTDTFHAFIKSESSVLVMFYAPWCGHCKRIKPEYINAAEELHSKGLSGKLAAVDATKETSLASEFGVKGFPTLKYFASGEFVFEVPSIRDKLKIVEFMLDPKEPPPPPPPEAPWSSTESDVLHLTEDTFRTSLKKKKHVLVMFYAPWCGHCKKAKPEMTSAAAHFRDDPKVECGAVDCTSEQSLCASYGVSSYPTFRYFNYYKNSEPYSGGRTAADFIRFLNDPENPATPPPPPPSPSPSEEWAGLKGADKLLHLTRDSFDADLRGKRVLVMFYAPWCGHCKAMKVDYALAAQDLSEEGDGSLGFLATVDATQERALAQEYGVKGFPTLLYFVDGRNSAEYDKRRTRVDLVAFVKERHSTQGSAAKTEL